MAIRASSILAALGQVESTVSSWPPQINGKLLLREHNIFRCMHDALPLRWSPALADESERYAIKKQGDRSVDEEPFVDPHAGKFKLLKQNRGYTSNTLKHWEEEVDIWYKGGHGPNAVTANQTSRQDPAPSPAPWKCGGEDADWTSNPGDFPCGPDACSQEVCKDKMGKHEPNGEKSARGLCYTDPVTKEINGCDYGSFSNTCAYNANGVCVYTEMPGQGSNVMLWQSATHVGCGMWSSNEGEASLVCDYGIKKKKGIKKEVKPRNKKSREQCEKEVDSNHLPAQVEISWKPKGLAASLEAGNLQCQDCPSGAIKDFRVFADMEVEPGHPHLRLLAFDDSGLPCHPLYRRKHPTVARWTYEGYDLYSAESGPAKTCVTVTKDFSGQKLDAALTQCTEDNYFGDANQGMWTFSAAGNGGENLCMGTPDYGAADSCVIDTFPVHEGPVSDDAAGKKVCDQGWQLHYFTGEETKLTEKLVANQSASRKKAQCPGENGCRKLRGNFACAIEENVPGARPDGCVLAGSEAECNAMGGDWCGDDIVTCNEGQYDKKDRNQDDDVDCEDGCDWYVCDEKIEKGTAKEHCFTESQIKSGDIFPPRGCKHGDGDNTCAYDANGNCVYQRPKHSTMTV